MFGYVEFNPTPRTVDHWEQHPVCTACWRRGHPDRTSVNTPWKYPASTEICWSCGHETESGLHISEPVYADE